MKKYFLTLIICVLVGTLFGTIMFSEYKEENTKQVSTIPKADVYFFQVGVYAKKENLDNVRPLYKDSVYMKKDDKYYLFVGITKDEENMEKLKKYFDSLGYDIYVKQIEVDNSGFLENLSQYDNLLKSAKTTDEIANINKTILAKYEELMGNG